MRKLDYIEALRGWAILGVILVHNSQYGINNYPAFLERFFNSGARGVQLFFVISAFTLFLSHYQRNEKAALKNFYTRRLFRVVPLYYCGILYFTWQLLFFSCTSCKLAELKDHIIANMFFANSIHPEWINYLVPGGWSISVEVLFYLIVPILFKYLKNLNCAVFFFIITLVLSFTLNSILINYFDNYSGYLNTYLFLYLPNQLPVFAIGIIGFFIIIENFLQNTDWTKLKNQ